MVYTKNFTLKAPTQYLAYIISQLLAQNFPTYPWNIDPNQQFLEELLKDFKIQAVRLGMPGVNPSRVCLGVLLEAIDPNPNHRSFSFSPTQAVTRTWWVIYRGDGRWDDKLSSFHQLNGTESQRTPKLLELRILLRFRGPFGGSLLEIPWTGIFQDFFISTVQFSDPGN